jgi:hypothetical protein
VTLRPLLNYRPVGCATHKPIIGVKRFAPAPVFSPTLTRTLAAALTSAPSHRAHLRSTAPPCSLTGLVLCSLDLRFAPPLASDSDRAAEASVSAAADPLPPLAPCSEIDRPLASPTRRLLSGGPRNPRVSPRQVRMRDPPCTLWYHGWIGTDLRFARSL